jgi:DNA modification methylase
MSMQSNKPVTVAYSTNLGTMLHGDSLDALRDMPDGSVNAIVTSPPFALTRAKSYGNKPEDSYIEWFMQFAKQFHRVLSDSGSLVLDLGGAWMPGRPIRSLYQYRLLIALHDQLDFRLAEDFYWHNTAKIPGPREWVTRQRVRVKDSVNLVWWLSKTDNPKANNRNVLVPYSASMKRLLARQKYNEGTRPSGHEVGKHWAVDNGGAIASNVLHGEPETEIENYLPIANTSSGDDYLKYCRRMGIPMHPARFPRALPDFFVRLTTEEGDLVLDPFAGSNMTGAVCEDLSRRWFSIDMDEEFIRGSVGRFETAKGLRLESQPWPSRT